MILNLPVIGIELALISAVMLTGDNNPTLARDTMFSVLMIVMNGLVGLSLLIGVLRHGLQVFNLSGANVYLVVLLPVAIVSLVLPSFTTSAPGGGLSTLQSPHFAWSCSCLPLVQVRAHERRARRRPTS